MDTEIFSALIPDTSEAVRTTISKALAKYGEPALRFAASKGIRVHALGKGERYATASAALARLGIDVDCWPAPPAGLFVVEERTVYVRLRSAMTVAHEFGHALDCALGNDVYRSATDPAIRSAFTNARNFVTPYSATGIDEYLAEGFRAWVGCNDTASHWPKATKARLRSGHIYMRGFRREAPRSYLFATYDPQNGCVSCRAVRRAITENARISSSTWHPTVRRRAYARGSIPVGATNESP